MKKGLSFILSFIMALNLTACSGSGDISKTLTKEGIAPYDLSESGQYILESFGMADTSQIISFHAPEEAVSLKVNVYRLGVGHTWEMIGGGSISLDAGRESAEPLTGAFTMRLREDYGIDFNINAAGRISFKTDAIMLDQEITGSTKGFLQEFRNIELNTEIPVAVMVYDSGLSMQNYSLQDYFEPSKFEGMDLVQAVTLEFSDKDF